MPSFREYGYTNPYDNMRNTTINPGSGGSDDMIHRIVMYLLLVGLGSMLVSCAEIHRQKEKGLDKISGLDTVLQRESPITTNIEDAVTEVPFLDDYNPKVAIPMSILPRTPDGAFILEKPGNYIFEAQSYCLKVASNAPAPRRGGKGYLYAPQKGPYADIIRNILQRSFAHPEIPQQDIQVLLWAILSRTKISDMSREMQQTAATLLTEKELFRINGGALGLIPETVLDRARAILPSQVRQVLAAEAQLREMLTKTQATYEELERIAVLSGDPAPQEGDREVPQGRWSFHPNGFFIRYMPRGYRQIRIELSVPEPLQIEQDQVGRITLIADKYGNRIETDYDDTIEPLGIAKEPSLKAYAFRSIRFDGPDPNNPGKRLQTLWANVGWTLVGVPAGDGRVGTPSSRFYGLKERYEWAQNHSKQLHDLKAGLKKIQGGSSPQFLHPRVMEEITAIGHLTRALGALISNRDVPHKTWIFDPMKTVKQAWQYKVARPQIQVYDMKKFDAIHHTYYANYRHANSPDKMYPSRAIMLSANNSNRSSGDGSPEYDPSGGMAQPGQEGRQRLSQSGRPTKHEEECLAQWRNCLENNDKNRAKENKSCLRSVGLDTPQCNEAAVGCMTDFFYSKRDEAARTEFYNCFKRRCGASIVRSVANCLLKAQKDWDIDEEQCNKLFNLCCLTS